MRILHKQNFLVVLFTISLRLLSISSATEKEILLQFKANISNDPFEALATWSYSNDPCNFSGVKCNSEGKVVKIVLWNASLSGSLSPSISELKSLRQVVLYGNKFSGIIPEEYGEIKTLWKINLSSNALSGSVPRFIGNLENLRFLDLSNNGFTGLIPKKLFQNCGKMKFISLSSNNLIGPIPDSVSNCFDLIGFDASNNGINGSIPSQICQLQNLAFFSVRNNLLKGSVDDQLSKCQSMEFLDISSNLFTGKAPFGTFEFLNMTYLNVSHNGFTGVIPEITSCSQRMQFIDASSNEFDGEISIGITRCINLRILDLESNRLNGSIPQEIGVLQSLSILRLGNNSIGGIIPPETGNIELLQILNLHNLNLHGEIPPALSNCRFLLELDISGNSVEGEIPYTLNNMTYLLILDLHNNNLNGSIPASLGSLSRIKFLDLSENLLSGPITESLRNLSKLTYFNVSYNNLSGEIPQTPLLTNFGSTSFFHNPRLCGYPLSKSCSITNISRRKTKVLSVSSIIAILAASFILFGVCVIVALNIKVKSKKGSGEMIMATETAPLALTESNVIIGKLVLFRKSLPYKFQDWESGTNSLLDKECLVGIGSLGSVYKTSFENGVSIAVKKLETLGMIKDQEEFEQEIGRLGNTRHPNLVSLQGFYWSSTMQLILHDFIPNGSLYDNLHSFGNTRNLNWDLRYKIAIGTARAISYLHHDCKPPILHLNIKSTNILLDENYEAKLSDYGLGKLLPRFHTSDGYTAPELARGSRPSEKCDIYSFGVVLLEIVTGRKAVEHPTVRELLEGGSTSDCFDRCLRHFNENELVQVMKLGLFCTAKIALKRPTMVDVVQFLEYIRSHNS